MEYGGGMNELPYPSDLTAAQWALIEPLLPAPKPKGRKRRVDLRKITNAILYVLKGGISWRMLPREFAPWKTVYHYFRLWRLAGLWDRIHDQLRDQVRVSKGRHICPSFAQNHGPDARATMNVLLLGMEKANLQVRLSGFCGAFQVGRSSNKLF